MKILIATHKEYDMPKISGYHPIMVGASLQNNIPNDYLRDDSGENISELNPFCNELTALYWAKYNLCDEDIIGLDHYRRYLGKKSGHKLQNILNKQQIYDALDEVDILLPKQRNYFIETQKVHYLNAHNHEPYIEMEKVIREKFPKYLPAFEIMEQNKKAHLFNMSIMKQADFQSYTNFIFGVLDEVAKSIPFETYVGQEKRVFGFLSERLMDTWLYTEKKTFREFPIVATEKTNWLDKGIQFLKRKFLRNSNKKVHF